MIIRSFMKLDNCLKIICISEKEGMIYNEMGININNLIEYKEEKGSILGFPDGTYDKNSDNSLFNFIKSETAVLNSNLSRCFETELIL